MQVGQFVLFRQIMGGRDQQVPFLVTHVHEEDGTISGVAFSGMPQVVQWARCAQDFAHVKQGEDNRQWQPMDDGGHYEPDPQVIQEMVAEALTVPEPTIQSEPIPEPAVDDSSEPMVESVAAEV